MIGPFEGLRHGFVEVGDELFDALLEIGLGGEALAAQELSDQDGKPDLDLIEPRGVLGGKMEGDPVALVAQEGLAAGARFEDAALAFYPEVLVDPAVAGDQPHDGLGEVDVEVVADDAPWLVRHPLAEARLEEGCEVGFGTAFADRALERAGGDIEGGDERLRAVALVFELPALDLARLHRQAGGQALQGLDAGHLIDRERAHPRRIAQRLAVDLADVPALGMKVRIGLGRQPDPQAMRLEVRTFLKSAPRCGAKAARRALGAGLLGPSRQRSSGSVVIRNPAAACRPGR